MTACVAGCYATPGVHVPGCAIYAEALVKAHDEGTCGGYYKCALCAFEVSEQKSREMHAVEGFNGRRSDPRLPTMTEQDARRARDARRAKAKAAKRTRKAQRRRAR